MSFLTRLTILLALISRALAQPTLAADSMVVDCVESLARISLNASNFLGKYVRFSALDQSGTVFEVTPTFAAQCGYTITRDFWGNIEFRASSLSCFSQIDDTSFSMNVTIDISLTPDMVSAVTYRKKIMCPIYPWNAREIICETNYMEVSVKRSIPLASESYVQDQPEDWAAAFPDAVAGNGSVWQIIFHLPSGRKAMLLSAAQDAGYGIRTTDSRIVLRAAYNASEASTGSFGGVDFSVLRSTSYFKQRWMIFMVDTAVACPVDGLKYTDDAILWSLPRQSLIRPLMAGANDVQMSSGAFGINLQKLSAGDVRNNYVIQNDSRATTIQIPLGAPSGYYKSHVINGEYSITYSVNIFLQNEWTDDKWGQTRQTIIKDITTPFKPYPPIVINETIPATRMFSVTVGVFLQDVNLVFITIGSMKLTPAEANARGYLISKLQHPDGRFSYRVNVPFDDPNVDKKVSWPFTIYTLNLTFGFSVIPQNHSFSVPAVIVASLQDIVLPSATGYCDDLDLHLVIKRGNIDQDWTPYVGNVRLTNQSDQTRGYLLFDNGTHIDIAVPLASSLVVFEDGVGAIAVTIPVSLKDPVGNTRSNFSMSCSYISREKIDCQPNGTIVITTTPKAVLQGLDLSQLVLRDQRCRPTEITDLSATFVFNANTCGTTSRFVGNTIIYENNIFHLQMSPTEAKYNLSISCNYRVNDSLVVAFTSEDVVLPTAEEGFGSLALVMRLSKDLSYSDFYNEQEYPVVKYLQDPLYFEVELQHTQDPQLELFLDNCWATPSSDRRSTPQWNIVVNSCENAADDYETIFHPVTVDSRVRFPGHLKRFEVKMFTFRQIPKGTIYFHCSVVICSSARLSADQLCSRRCIPEKQRLGRSVDDRSDVHGYVSSGSVQFMTDH
ncbi:hypothetical protein NDU88_002352 [Pleurodeles waltl]|uniref:ZP domain-containing protein n=1 Tax=Pleurodeles waltl TaxID=8319 RepID=A0AAV7RDI5_PLEWA|nr:hypothetical protein NDU88_002352 [Pleurodeles waltl]